MAEDSHETLTLFSSKDKSKNDKILSAAILLGALRVNQSCVSRLKHGLFSSKMTKKYDKTYLDFGIVSEAYDNLSESLTRVKMNHFEGR